MKKDIEARIEKAIKKGRLTNGLFLDNGVLRIAKRGVSVAVLQSGSSKRIADKLLEKKRRIEI